jgi:hypothetical protein
MKWATGTDDAILKIFLDNCPGGVAQWTSHLPRELEDPRVRIPPAYKVFRETYVAVLLSKK